MDYSIGDYVFEFDSVDIDYPLDITIKAYQKLLTGYDVVAAVKQDSHPRLSVKLFYHMLNRNSEFDEVLQTESFCVKSRKAVNKADQYGKIIPYRKAVEAASGLLRGYVSYGSLNVHDTKVAAKRKGQIETGIDAIILFTDFFFKISIIFSIIMALIMLIIGGYVIAVYLSPYKQVEGWAPIMGAVCLGFLGVFCIMTILLKHIEIVLKLLFKKKPYVVDSVEIIEKRRDA